MEEKTRIREQIKAARGALTGAEVMEKSREIAKRLLALKQFSEAGCVMFYHAFDNEVETEEVIEKALGLGKLVLLPRCNITGRDMEVCEVRNLEADLRSSAYGIMEPVEHTKVVRQLEQIDLCVVPGVAFDRAGHRIGQGKGFYDVFLARLSPRTLKVAMAFELQLVESIPHQKHDVPMDMIITERETLAFPRC